VGLRDGGGGLVGPAHGFFTAVDVEDGGDVGGREGPEDEAAGVDLCLFLSRSGRGRK